MTNQNSTHVITLTIVFALTLLIVPEADAADDLFGRERNFNREKFSQFTDISVNLYAEDEEGNNAVVINRPEETVEVKITPTPTPSPSPTPTPTPQPTPESRFSFGTLRPSTTVFPTRQLSANEPEETETKTETVVHEETVRESSTRKEVTIVHEETHTSETRKTETTGEEPQSTFRLPSIFRIPNTISRSLGSLFR